MNSTLSSSHFAPHHLLKQIEINVFNIFAERITNNSNNNNNYNINESIHKRIIYIQIDLAECVFELTSLKKSLEDTLLSSSNQECRCSFLKTKGLIDMFKQNDQCDEPISNGHKKCYYYYLFKVISRGNVHSLTNSQFNAKLRADIQIEIVPLFTIPSTTTSSDSQPITSRIIVLGMMSKLLYFYNFLYENKCYIFKSSELLAINFVENKQPNQMQTNIIDSPHKLIIMNEYHAILDEHTFSDVNAMIVINKKCFLKTLPLKEVKYIFLK